MVTVGIYILEYPHHLEIQVVQVGRRTRSALDRRTFPNTAEAGAYLNGLSTGLKLLHIPHMRHYEYRNR